MDGVMERPSPSPSPSSVSGLGGLKGEDLQRERDKWDAWNSQKGLGRTEAKRRYIEVLIETMHKYATSEYVFCCIPGSTTLLCSGILYLFSLSGATDIYI